MDSWLIFEMPLFCSPKDVPWLFTKRGCCENINYANSTTTQLAIPQYSNDMFTLDRTE